MSNNRTIGWFSCGAASAVAFKLLLDENPNAIPVYCETGAEHADNVRFIMDCESWFGKRIERIRSVSYSDTWDVWTRRKYLSGIRGAPCSVELKVSPRLRFQVPTDVHIFGYTADPTDIARATRFQHNYPEVRMRAPLIERHLTKAACLGTIQKAGIQLPVMYRLGFQNNNCIPCVKATSPSYWALIRHRFPQQFVRMADLSRQLGVRLCRLNGVRAFIDEIPQDHPISIQNAISCDFLCAATETVASFDVELRSSHQKKAT